MGPEYYSLQQGTDLANLAITISNNIAYKMLTRDLGRENIVDFMTHLGGKIVFPEGKHMTFAKDMSHSIYHVGIPGNLPEEVIVARKEGDVAGVANDMGIVFADNPYILVVLSKGVPDIDGGFTRITKISQMVYDYHKAVSDNIQ
jgi:beta-lactamase class A